MFLNALKKRNSELICAAFEMHNSGEISPNTYIIDMDMLQQNVSIIASESKKTGLIPYAMTKQIGRNAGLFAAIKQAGIEKFVAVDPWEAQNIAKSGHALGNVGHIVQLPKSMVREIISYKPEYVTIFNYENALEVSKAAKNQGFVQNIMLRLDDDSFVYPGQSGGIKIEQLVEVAEKISSLKNINISGITAFPCVVFDPIEKTFGSTGRIELLQKARAILCDQGYNIDTLNVPSANCVATLQTIKNMGATHIEPGHALTGTTPLHAIDFSQKETPCIAYISEVVHTTNDCSYVFGGGNYPRGNLKNAIAGETIEKLMDSHYDFCFPPSENIDYYGTISATKNETTVGATVIASFRTQIFVTRANVALVSGIHSNQPKIQGLYSSLGERLA